MELSDVKCPFCGKEYKIDNSLTEIECENCKKVFTKEKGSKYFKSVLRIQKEERKIAEGAKYAETDRLLDKANFYIANEDFESALNALNSALELTTVDPRVYFAIAAAKTKNFTDLDDTSHVVYLKRAIELAGESQKEEIKRTYSAYYKKRSIPQEEREEYEKQEADAKTKRVESLLKEGIPLHFSREKSVKTLKIILPVISALAVGGMIAAFITENALATIVSSLIMIAAAGVAFAFMSNNSKVKLFNSVLDFYDSLNYFDFTSAQRSDVMKQLEEIAVSYVNKETDTTLRNKIRNLVEIALKTGNEKVAEYIENDKKLSREI